MRNHGPVLTTIWRSRKFRALGDNSDARTGYFYFLVNPHSTSIGAYIFEVGYGATDLGWSEERVRQMIQDLSNVGLVTFNEAEAVILVADYLKKFPCTNPSHAKGAAKAAVALPACPERATVLRQLCEDEKAAKCAEAMAIIAPFLQKTAEKPQPCEDPADSPSTGCADGVDTMKPKPEPKPKEKPEPKTPVGGIADATPSDSSVVPLDTVLYQRGKQLLGTNAGGQITRLKAATGSVGAALEAIERASKAENPAEFIGAIIRNRNDQASAQKSKNPVGLNLADWNVGTGS